MSEVMTTEAIVEAEWLLDGFWTKPRYALQLKSGAWSDIDVLSYHPDRRHLVVSESKVQGAKDAVFAYTKHTKEKYGSIRKYDNDHYFSFLRHLPLICQDGIVFQNFSKQVRILTVQLVCNYAVAPDLQEEAVATIESEIGALGLPCKISFKLDSTLDVFCRVIEAEKNSDQNRRYGNPILDLARELNRYLDPAVKNAGRTKQDRQNVRVELQGRLLKALRVTAGEA